MKKSLKISIIIASFAILFLLISSGYNAQKSKEKEFKMLGEKIVTFADTTDSRVVNSVVTLPEGDIVVGLKNNKGTYLSLVDKTEGSVEIQKEFLKTNFIGGIYGKREPRLDAVVPMYVSSDSHGGSTYVVLFNDRGDAAIEKSYARLGDKAVVIQSINALPRDPSVKDEEYRIDIIYKMEGVTKASNALVSIPKELIISVVDGHFDPNGAVSK